MGHNREVFSADYSPDGTRIVTASADGDARVWRPGAPEPSVILRHGSPVHEATFSPNGRRVVTASDDGLGRVWTVDPTELINENRRRQTVCLSGEEEKTWKALTGTGAQFAGAQPCRPEVRPNAEPPKPDQGR